MTDSIKGRFGIPDPVKVKAEIDRIVEKHLKEEGLMATEHTPMQPRELKAAGAGNSGLYRELKWKLKQANKTMGKQGETIYQLRNEIAALRAKNRGLKDMVDDANTRALEYQSLYYDAVAPKVLPNMDGIFNDKPRLDLAPSQIEGLA